MASVQSSARKKEESRTVRRRLPPSDCVLEIRTALTVGYCATFRLYILVKISESVFDGVFTGGSSPPLPKVRKLAINPVLEFVTLLPAYLLIPVSGRALVERV